SVSWNLRTRCWTGMPLTKTVSTVSYQPFASAVDTFSRALAKRTRHSASSFLRSAASSSSDGVREADGEGDAAGLAEADGLGGGEPFPGTGSPLRASRSESPYVRAGSLPCLARLSRSFLAASARDCGKADASPTAATRRKAVPAARMGRYYYLPGTRQHRRVVSRKNGGAPAPAVRAFAGARVGCDRP